jgi:hypothetical protein
MRWLGNWAAAIVGSAVLSASGCLTSQEESNGGGGVEDPPVTFGGSGGSSGSTSQGGGAGEDTGGSGGSGGSSRGGSGGTSGTGSGACRDDADCEARTDDKSRCSAPTGDCVECLDISDCEANEECDNNACKPFTPCATSDDCPQNQVCNTTTDRCVQCVSQGDCGTGEVCVTNTCQRSCTSDTQCLLLGMRCNTTGNYCASCVNNSDCPDDRNCQAGSCVRDICVGGSASCDGNTLTTCNSAGSEQSYPTPCDSRETCVEDSGEASCEPWVCDAGTTGCSLTSEQVVECSEDGLEETVVEDCEANDQLCVDASGECADVLCEPNTRFCQGNTIQQCDAYGTSFSTYTTCTTNQLCNPQTVTCAVPLCTPSQPACNGSLYTTCNSTGFGYASGGTDCSMTDEVCTTTGCTSGTVDIIPPATTPPTLYMNGALPSYLMVNAFSVTTNRTLTQIEQYMNPSMATMLTWRVYESLTQSGSYTSIASTTTVSTTGVGYQSSGAIAVPLVAGRFYAIGVSWTTPSLIFGYQMGTAAQTVSFGAMFSATFLSGPPTGAITIPASGSYFNPQRLTTGAP